MNSSNPEDITFISGVIKQKEKTNGTSHWKFILILILFVLGLYGTRLMWFTSIYYDAIFKNFVTLGEGKLLHEIWKNQPLKPLLCVYIFNYTNTQEYFSEENRRSKNVKLKVKETGPYCFREEGEKTNIVFLNNGTAVTYNDRRAHIFLPEASVGSLNDTVIGPNVLIIGAYQRMGDFSSFLQSTGDAMFGLFGAKIITEAKVGDYLFGLEDDIFSAIHPLAQIVEGGSKKVPKKFGLLTKRTGLSQDKIMVHTGDDGQYDEIGQMMGINDDTKLNAWPSNSCDAITGSDGSFFPRSKIQGYQDVQLFYKDFCKKFPLKFDSVVDVGFGIKANRYKLRRDAFNYSLSENVCYCNMSNLCQYNGILDIATCSATNEAPLAVSLPHLLNSNANFNDKNEEIIVGLEPNITKHDSTFDIYPIVGGMVRMRFGLQLNLLVKNPTNDRYLNPLEDKTVLPLAWYELSCNEIPKMISILLFLMTYVTRWGEVALKWLILIFTFSMAFVLFKKFLSNFCRTKIYFNLKKKLNVNNNTTEKQRVYVFK